MQSRSQEKRSFSTTYKKLSNLTQKLFTELCFESNLPEPEFEKRFDEERRWRLDVYFERDGKKVGLEIEGGAYGKRVRCHKCGVEVKTKTGKPVLTPGGRHTSTMGYLKDIEKYNAATCSGILLLRVTPNSFLSHDTIALIKKTLGET